MQIFLWLRCRKYIKNSDEAKRKLEHLASMRYVGVYVDF